MGKQAPAPKDYTQAAQQQSESSQQNVQQQTQANRPNVNGPFANQQWSQGPNGEWTLSSGLNGPLAGAADSLGQTAAANAQHGIGTGDQAREQAITSAYGEATKRLDPQWAQRRQAQQSQLANQGLDPNSEAARNAERQLSGEENDAYSSAMNGAIGQGTAAGSAIFGQNLAGQMLPYQQMGAMQGLGQTPQFNQAGQADPTQYLGASMGQFGSNLQSWQAQNKANADAIKGGTQLAGSLATLPFGF